jgi:hypothetical protein
MRLRLRWALKKLGAAPSSFFNRNESKEHG